MKRLLPSIAILFVFSVAQANDCELTIESNDMMQYDKKVMSAPKSCGKVKVTLKHTGKLAKEVMGHNWVLVKKSDMDGLIQASVAAGKDNYYFPAGDERIIAATDMIGGGESASTEFDISALDQSEEYMFLCTFIGHYALMKGDFNVN